MRELADVLVEDASRVVGCKPCAIHVAKARGAPRGMVEAARRRAALVVECVVHISKDEASRVMLRVPRAAVTPGIQDHWIVCALYGWRRVDARSTIVAVASALACVAVVIANTIAARGACILTETHATIQTIAPAGTK